MRRRRTGSSAAAATEARRVLTGLERDGRKHATERWAAERGLPAEELFQDLVHNQGQLRRRTAPSHAAPGRSGAHTGIPAETGRGEGWRSNGAPRDNRVFPQRGLMLPEKRN